MALIYFLYKNNWWLDVENDKLYLFANAVAQSRPDDRVTVVKKIRSFIRKYLTRSGSGD